MTITNNPFVRTETEAKGFALYVGIDEHTALAHGTTLADIVASLRNTLDQIAQGLALESFAAVALAKTGTYGRNIDLVRSALGDPRATQKLTERYETPADGVVIDLGRRKIFIDGENAELTGKEFALVEYLVDNSGTSISREELVDVLWPEDKSVEARTVDVHVRRLRTKLGQYADVVRTLRGEGYRFDRHPDVLIEGL
jgi:DNA-binding response OmpR family regulator